MPRSASEAAGREPKKLKQQAPGEQTQLNGACSPGQRGDKPLKQTGNGYDMAAQRAKPTKPRKCKASKINREKVMELARQGMNCTDIAKHQGVYPSTVWRYLEKISPENKQLEQFKNKRADVFAHIAGKSINLLDKVLDTYDEETLSAMPAATKNGLIGSLTNLQGCAFDKERVELDKSTSIVSIHADIAALRTVDKSGRNPVDNTIVEEIP